MDPRDMPPTPPGHVPMPVPPCAPIREPMPTRERPLEYRDLYLLTLHEYRVTADCNLPWDDPILILAESAQDAWRRAATPIVKVGDIAPGPCDRTVAVHLAAVRADLPSEDYDPYFSYRAYLIMQPPVLPCLYPDLSVLLAHQWDNIHERHDYPSGTGGVLTRDMCRRCGVVRECLSLDDLTGGTGPLMPSIRYWPAHVPDD